MAVKSKGHATWCDKIALSEKSAIVDNATVVQPAKKGNPAGELFLKLFDKIHKEYPFIRFTRLPYESS